MCQDQPVRSSNLQLLHKAGSVGAHGPAIVLIADHRVSFAILIEGNDASTPRARRGRQGETSTPRVAPRTEQRRPQPTGPAGARAGLLQRGAGRARRGALRGCGGRTASDHLAQPHPCVLDHTFKSNWGLRNEHNYLDFHILKTVTVDFNLHDRCSLFKLI
jgi:hypothetical protein